MSAAPKPGSEVVLYASDDCPFAQRILVVMHEHRIDLTVARISLAAPPLDFVRLSPSGRVPLLVTPDGALHESRAILEYLDATANEPLMPSQAWGGALSRAWMTTADAAMSALANATMATTHEAFDAATAHLIEILRELESVVAATFFFGPKFGLVDVSFAPFLLYLHEFSARAPGWSWDSLPRTRRWMDVVIRRPSVQASQSQNWQERMRDYGRGVGAIWLGVS